MPRSAKGLGQRRQDVPRAGPEARARPDGRRVLIGRLGSTVATAPSASPSQASHRTAHHHAGLLEDARRLCDRARSSRARASHSLLSLLLHSRPSSDSSARLYSLPVPSWHAAARQARVRDLVRCRRVHSRVLANACLRARRGPWTPPRVALRCPTAPLRTAVAGAVGRGTRSFSLKRAPQGPARRWRGPGTRPERLPLWRCRSLPSRVRRGAGCMRSALLLLCYAAVDDLIMVMS